MKGKYWAELISTVIALSLASHFAVREINAAFGVHLSEAVVSGVAIGLVTGLMAVKQQREKEEALRNEGKKGQANQGKGNKPKK